MLKITGYTIYEGRDYDDKSYNKIVFELIGQLSIGGTKRITES